MTTAVAVSDSLILILGGDGKRDVISVRTNINPFQTVRIKKDVGGDYRCFGHPLRYSREEYVVFFGECDSTNKLYMMNLNDCKRREFADYSDLVK